MTDPSTPALDDSRMTQLLAWYGDGADGSAPTRAQWAALAARPPAQPVQLVNHFRFHPQAKYSHSEAEPCSGREAFSRYSAVSVGALARVGGGFVSIGLGSTPLVGDDAPWDMIVIAQYPHPAAVAALFEAPDYRACYIHRTAACARQRVSVALPLPVP